MHSLFPCGCALLVLAVRPAFATTYHVAPDSSGDVLNIQAAIDAAASGDEILLSDGVFTGDGNWDLNFGTKELVLRSVNGYEATTIDCGFDSLYDIRHRGIILEGGQTGTTRIEGITVQHSNSGMDGGALRFIGASPVVRNLRIQENPAFGRGAGIFLQGGSPTIEDCVFGGSWYGSELGAAIYSEQSWLTVQGSSFTGFHCLSGSVYLDGGTLTDCTFTNNRGPEGEQGPTLRVVGGPASILNCTFRYNFGGCIVGGHDLLIGNCLFEDNVADMAAGVRGGGTITILNSTFRRNLTGFWDSAVSTDGQLSLDHCLFIANRANFGRGGTVVHRGSLNATHCTFAGNMNPGSEHGSAITISGGGAVTIDHTIIALGPDGTGGGIHCDDEPVSMDVSCTDIYGNAGGDWVGCVAGMEGANGNIAADPLFCDIAGGDLSLQAGSPCAPANTGECGLIGALGPWCGPLAVEPRSWGSIKARYR